MKIKRVVCNVETQDVKKAHSLLLVNDDDFGIAGGRMQIVVVPGTGIARTQRGTALARELERAGFSAVGSCGAAVE